MEEQPANRMVIGMDPHKGPGHRRGDAPGWSVAAGGRFDTDRAGYTAMLEVARAWPERVWAVEGCNGIGRHVALRLLADGEQVIDVPPRLSARVRCSPPGRAARPTPQTHTPSLWSGSGWPGCAPSSTTSSSPCCGCWSTGAGPWGRTTPGWHLSCITFCWS